MNLIDYIIGFGGDAMDVSNATFVTALVQDVTLCAFIIGDVYFKIRQQVKYASKITFLLLVAVAIMTTICVVLISTTCCILTKYPNLTIVYFIVSVIYISTALGIRRDYDLDDK
jgi:hypothetical protein